MITLERFGVKTDKPVYNSEFLENTNKWKPKTEQDLINEWEEELKEMREKGFNSLGFYMQGDKIYFWSHYGKQECIFKEIEGLVRYSQKSYGLTHGIILINEKGEHTHTWMITKDFAEWVNKELSLKLERVGEMPKWTRTN